MYAFGKIVELIMSITLAVTLSGCNTSELEKNTHTTPVVENQNYSIQDNTKSEVGEDMREKILGLVNNEETADNLIKVTYSSDVLQNLNNNISELLVETPPECVRLSTNKDVVYFVYKSDNGHYAFWMYSLSENTGKVMQKWYCGKPIFSQNFDKLKSQNATLEDVKEFDPYGSYTSLYLGSATSLYTYHYTVDGFMIKLDYGSSNGKDDTISKITKLSGEDNPIYYNLLPIDKSLIAK